MTTKTIKILVFAALLVHGMGENINHILCLILYLGAAIFGIITAMCFKEWLCMGTSWQSLATITALISTFCLVLFPHALAMFFNKAGAIAVNLIIYYSILFNYQWPSAAFEN